MSRKRTTIPVGTRYSKMVIIEEIIPDSISRGMRHRKVLCRCDCGKIKAVYLSNLRAGYTSSCGCHHAQVMHAMCATHGASVGQTRGTKISPEYRTWRGIKARCSPFGSSPVTHNYARRGVKVCERWLNSYEAFLSDMGKRPSERHSIDRIDVNGDYCPENCRWATSVQQANNKRNTYRFTFYGLTKTLSEWSRISGVPSRMVRARLARGWSEKRAVWTNPITKYLKVKQ